MRCAGYFSSCVVTNRHLCGEERLPGVVEDALAGGIEAVQLREKDLSGKDLYRIARVLREVTQRAGARLMINDRLDVALAVGADGVHLGGTALPLPEVKRVAPGLVTGMSCHSVTDAVTASRQGADYIMLGPLYDTPSKASLGTPLGLAVLREACGAVSTAVVAIGGITPERVDELLEAGASGVAVMGAVFNAEHPGAAASRLVQAVRSHLAAPILASRHG